MWRTTRWKRTSCQRKKQRFVETAIRATRKELEMLWGGIPENAPPSWGRFVALHIMLLNDATISREPLKVIDSLRCNAEWALKTQSDQLVAPV